MTPAALQSHLLAAASRFPVLGSRLAWVDDRPVLLPGAAAPIAVTASLNFAATGAPQVWRAVIRESPGGASLEAVFSHASADGGSMMRLIAAIEARLGGEEESRAGMPSRPPRPAALPWLAEFLLERARSHLVLAPSALAPMGASWFRIGPEDRDRLIARARAACGRMVPFLSSAAALATAKLATGGRRISLNIPIARSNADAVQGFGFGIGSLLLGEEIDPRMDTESLAKRLAPRIERQSNEGWDAGLDWFLGQDPARHQAFARIRARGRADPAINISWKGFYRGLGGEGGALDVACFGAAPTGHVSAHADLGGLAVSFTAPRSQAVRESFLKLLAVHLGIGGELSLNTYDDRPVVAALA